jgi:hypothetical protein
VPSGNGVSGLAIPPRDEAPAIFQFADRRFYVYVMLAMLLGALAIALAMKQSRALVFTRRRSS